MENMGQHKTIQPNCPETYSQTWNTVEAPPTSPRINKRKPRMNHSSSYPAQSWLDSEKNVVRLKPMRTVSSQPLPNPCPYRRTPPQFGGDRRVCRQPPARRPDPSAPHLKYGLFTNPRKPVILGSLTNNMPSKYNLKKKTPTDVSLRNLQKQRERVQIDDDCNEPEKQPSDAPLLIFRPISHRYAQRLSASDVHHLDIKPGKRPISPLTRATVV